MNIAAISGTLVSKAIARGTETRVLLFTVMTRERGAENKKEIVSFVPCALFNGDAELETLLTTEGKDMWVEFTGRVHCSCYQSGQQPKFNTEVIVNPRTFCIHGRNNANNQEETQQTKQNKERK